MPRDSLFEDNLFQDRFNGRYAVAQHLKSAEQALREGNLELAETARHEAISELGRLEEKFSAREGQSHLWVRNQDLITQWQKEAGEHRSRLNMVSDLISLNESIANLDKVIAQSNGPVKTSFETQRASLVEELNKIQKTHDNLTQSENKETNLWSLRVKMADLGVTQDKLMAQQSQLESQLKVLDRRTADLSQLESVKAMFSPEQLKELDRERADLPGQREKVIKGIEHVASALVQVKDDLKQTEQTFKSAYQAPPQQFAVQTSTAHSHPDMSSKTKSRYDNATQPSESPQTPLETPPTDKPTPSR